MQSGKTVNELALEIARQESAKRDFLAPTNKVRFSTENQPRPVLVMERDQEEPLSFSIKPHAHQQIATHTGIPRRYYDRMLQEEPGLLTLNVNQWMHKEPKTRMFRTLDGDLRAMLSDRYNRDLDHALAGHAIEAAHNLGSEIEIVSTEITDTRLYIKAVNHRQQGEIKVGDIVESGALITNSEIGISKFRVEPFLHRLVCLNGMVSPIHAGGGMKRVHIGRRYGEIDEPTEIYRDDTREADRRALILKVRDAVGHAFDQAQFARATAALRESTQKRITGNPEKVMDKIVELAGIQESERGGILTHLVNGGDLSAYGLANAITAHANDLKNYDRGTELQRIGGEIISLPPTAWSEIADAA